MLGHGYFASPDYLVVKAGIRATVLFPSFIYQTGTNIYIYVKIFPGAVRYWGQGLPSCCIVTVVSFEHPFIMTVYLSPYFCSVTMAHWGIHVTSMIITCYDLCLIFYSSNILGSYACWKYTRFFVVSGFSYTLWLCLLVILLFWYDLFAVH